MRRVFALVAVLAWTSPLVAQGPAGEAWKLSWSDEFDGSSIDRTKWDFDLGNGFFSYEANQWIAGWGNNERQYYTREPENAFVKDGSLYLRAIKESFQGFGYTSARVKTKKRDGSTLFAQKYGKFEFRAKCPAGKGVWPALWMLPADEKYGGWAASGEIDVLEARGQEPNKILGTLHFGGRWPANAQAGGEHLFAKGESIADWHVYAVEWEPSEIRWYVDGKQYASQRFWWSSAKFAGGKGQKPANESELNPWPAPFNRPFTLVMNVAVGGNFVGPPALETAFPVEMLVDYVRVYAKSSYPPPSPRPAGPLPFAK